MSHTQGPWIADHVGLQWWVLDSDGNYLCELVNDDEEGHFEKDAKKREGNARLMAFAPDLLAALEQIADGDQMPGHVAYLSKKRMSDIARAAIAKAQGR